MGKISSYLQEMIDELYSSDLVVKDNNGNVIYQHYNNRKEVDDNDDENLQGSECWIEKTT